MDNPVAFVASTTQSQWFKRPGDQKFSSLEDLHDYTHRRKVASYPFNAALSSLHFMPAVDNRLVIEVAGKQTMEPTNWSFKQLCAIGGAPATYLPDLPAELAAECLNHNLKQKVKDRDRAMQLLCVDNATDTHSISAVTSEKYGRIWDYHIVDAAIELCEKSGGRWYSPLDWGKEKRALFASDHDIHMLFIDGGSLVEGGGERDVLNRGWIIGNSEVGSQAFYFATFLFRVVCGNFAIHGIEDVSLLKIRHTMLAPSRWAGETFPVIEAYTSASTKPLEAAIRKAKDLLLPASPDQKVTYFRNRKFTTPEIERASFFARREEGDDRTLWQMINGFTRAAQEIQFRDTRVNLEKRAGALLKMVA